MENKGKSRNDDLNENIDIKVDADSGNQFSEKFLPR